MEMTRRGFLKALLAAPAAVALMKVSAAAELIAPARPAPTAVELLSYGPMRARLLFSTGEIVGLDSFDTHYDVGSVVDLCPPTWSPVDTNFLKGISFSGSGSCAKSAINARNIIDSYYSADAFISKAPDRAAEVQFYEDGSWQTAVGLQNVVISSLSLEALAHGDDMSRLDFTVKITCNSFEVAREHLPSES